MEVTIAFAGHKHFVWREIFVTGTAVEDGSSVATFVPANAVVVCAASELGIGGRLGDVAPQACSTARRAVEPLASLQWENSVGRRLRVSIVSHPALSSSLQSSRSGFLMGQWLVDSDWEPCGGFVPQPQPQQPILADDADSPQQPRKRRRVESTTTNPNPPPQASSIPSVANVFGLPLGPYPFAGFETELAGLDRQCGVNCSPRALYHGTASAAVAHIFDKGFQPTHGMLGDGVYAGSFYKACRFAGWTTVDYQRRLQGDAAIIRCLGFAQDDKIIVRSADSPPCACSDCAATEHAAGRDESMRHYVDHASTWRDVGAQGTFLGIHALPPICAGGKQRYSTRNPEWCLLPDVLLPRTAACLDVTSLSVPHYNPLQRDQQLWFAAE